MNARIRRAKLRLRMARVMEKRVPWWSPKVRSARVHWTKLHLRHFEVLTQSVLLCANGQTKTLFYHRTHRVDFSSTQANGCYYACMLACTDSNDDRLSAPNLQETPIEIDRRRYRESCNMSFTHSHWRRCYGTEQWRSSVTMAIFLRHWMVQCHTVADVSISDKTIKINPCSAIFHF